MARSWRTTGLLLLAGLGCLGVGTVVGAAYNEPIEQLWQDPVAAEAATSKVEIVTQLPTFRGLVQRVEPSVVSVRASMPLPAPVEGAPEAEPTQSDATKTAPTQSGSGFIINGGGLVLTSRHIVVGATGIEVIVPNHPPTRADLIGQDPATDLALLRLASVSADLPVLAMGDSEKVQAGDWIVAVGNPFGFTRTVTAGLVSYVGRHLPSSDLGVSRDFLQISAAINPGSSGCPVFDMNGHVVGVATQVAESAQGISFAIPSHSVKWALTKMMELPDGIVHRGYLGIHFGPRRDPSSHEPLPGAVIVGVAEGDPADRAGLRSGDVVLAVNGAPIRDPKDLHQRIVCSDPGTSMALQLLRNDQVCDPIVAVLGEIGQRPSTPETP